MSELERERGGRCGCGEVTLQVDRLQRHVMQCHCENCRRLTGNFVSAVRVREVDLRWSDPNGHMAEQDYGYAQYGFCRNCGSTLFFRAVERPEEPSVMVGLFDDATGIELHSIWFAQEAHGYQALDPAVPHYSGNE
ncbi:MAG: GFA family protein [Actinomycetota bacterium]